MRNRQIGPQHQSKKSRWSRLKKASKHDITPRCVFDPLPGDGCIFEVILGYREVSHHRRTMARSMLIFAAVASQVVVAAVAFVNTAAPNAATCFFTPVPLYPSPSSAKNAAAVSQHRLASPVRRPLGAMPPCENLSEVRPTARHRALRARWGHGTPKGLDNEAVPGLGEIIPGLSELELRRKREDRSSHNEEGDAAAIRFPSQRATTRVAVVAASALATGLALAVFAPGPAAAAIKTAASAGMASAGGSGGEHLHVGQKIASFFRRGGLPDWATLMAISAMPVVELRGGVPVGVWMGMPIAKVFGLCVAGNMVPIPIILLALRSAFVQKLAKPVLDRAREKAAGFGDEKSQSLALTLFVGIPLPGTGAWTGAMGAFLLGMPFQKASVIAL